MAYARKSRKTRRKAPTRRKGSYTRRRSTRRVSRTGTGRNQQTVRIVLEQAGGATAATPDPNVIPMTPRRARF